MLAVVTLTPLKLAAVRDYIVTVALEIFAIVE